MNETAIVLGGNGRFGRAAIEAFEQAGWRVKSLVRSQHNMRIQGCESIIADAFDAEGLARACSGADVIVNALNPPYECWVSDLPKLTANVIESAKGSGATVMIPGNVYNYGTVLPALLRESTPHIADTVKGRLRIEMEQAYREAASTHGVRTIILRGGDFIEAQQTGNWFDSYITNKSSLGKTTYPGPLDVKHAWAYLPDMARAMQMLARIRDRFEGFSEFGFSGYDLTGRHLVTVIESVTGIRQKTRSMPWPLLKILALFVPRIREVLEMRYLWQRPHEIDGRRLAQVLPEFVPTPIEIAMSDALGVEPTGVERKPLQVWAT